MNWNKAKNKLIKAGLTCESWKMHPGITGGTSLEKIERRDVYHDKFLIWLKNNKVMISIEGSDQIFTSSKANSLSEAVNFIIEEYKEKI